MVKRRYCPGFKCAGMSELCLEQIVALKEKVTALEVLDRFECPEGQNGGRRDLHRPDLQVEHLTNLRSDLRPRPAFHRFGN